MATGTSLDRLASPIQFAVKTSIDASTIAGWISDMTKAFREYSEKVEGRSIFSGNSGIRVTPRGTVSSQNRNQTGNAVKSSLPRFLTISREAKSLQVTLISTVYTEILCSIIYLHHRAFELEDLIIFSCRLADWLGRQTNATRIPTHVANAVREYRESSRQAMTKKDFGSDAMQSISGEIDARSTSTSTSTLTLTSTSTSTSDANTCANSKSPFSIVDKASIPHIYMPGEHEERRTRAMIQLWFKAFRLYVSRNPFCQTDLGRHLEDMKELSNTKSIERFQNRLEDIRNCFPKISADHGHYRPITIDSADDVILFKTDDFNYPFDASWFELMYIRSCQGMGHARLKNIAKNLNSKGITSPFALTYNTIVDRISKDIRENLLPAISDIDDRMKNQIIIKNEFIESVANVIGDYIIDMAIQYFNFAAGFTDMASGTTIQLRAVKTIFFQMQSTYLLPLTSKQASFLNDVMTHVIKTSMNK